MVRRVWRPSFKPEKMGELPACCLTPTGVGGTHRTSQLLRLQALFRGQLVGSDTPAVPPIHCFHFPGGNTEAREDTRLARGAKGSGVVSLTNAE